MTATFNIYPREMNWDMDILPIASFETETEEN